MRLVYVIDCHDPDLTSYECRVPTLLARLICRLSRKRALDYAPTPAGFSPSNVR